MECSGVEPAAYYNHTLSGPFPKVNNSYGTKYLDLIKKYFGQPTPEKKFSVYNVTPGSIVNNTGVAVILDSSGTLTKSQACAESCNRLGQI